MLLAFSTCFLYLNENVLPCGCIGFNIYHCSSQGSQSVKALKHSIASIVHICTCYIFNIDDDIVHELYMNRYYYISIAGYLFNVLLNLVDVEYQLHCHIFMKFPNLLTVAN